MLLYAPKLVPGWRILRGGGPARPLRRVARGRLQRRGGGRGHVVRGLEAAEREQVYAMRAVLGGGELEVGRLGHGLGITLTEWPSFTDRDNTELRENMVLTLEPSLSYGDGRIMVHEENIVVRAEGAALLTERAPPELPVIGAAA